VRDAAACSARPAAGGGPAQPDTTTAAAFSCRPSAGRGGRDPRRGRRSD